MEIESGLAFPLGRNYEYIQEELIRVKSRLDPFIEVGEILQEATEREILEETGLTIKVGDPVSILDVINRDEAGQVRFHYVIVDFLADYVDGELMIGDDASDAQWVKPCELERY